MSGILLVGGGNMGRALVGGWRAQGVDAAGIVVVEPDAAAAERLRAAHGVAVAAGPAALPPGFAPDVVLLAVKPQLLDLVSPAYRFATDAGAVALSIAAGKTIAALERGFGAGAAVVRAMPNTPAQVSRGIAVLCANAAVGAAQRDRCERLLAAVGEVAWVEDEALLDPVTAVSGSGPAYVFLLIECLAAAGVDSGLPRDLATRLARATVAGSGELARQSDETAEALRHAVTSPGGTTEAALAVLMAEDGLRPLLSRAVAAATRRSRELAA